MTNQGHIVAVDSVSPSVFIISEDGVLVHWFDCSDYMREPSDIAISGKFNNLSFPKILFKLYINVFKHLRHRLLRLRLQGSQRGCVQREWRVPASHR